MNRASPSYPFFAGPRHLALTASAGSGKTYQLTARMIGLLTLDISPDRIVALTFTKKSAGEIFARLLTRVAEAAQTPSKRAELNASLPGWAKALDGPRAVKMLRQLIDLMPRLSIGTIDSFFYRTAHAFCFEFGLPPDMTLLEGYAAEQARDLALDRLFSSATRPDEIRHLAESVKRASFGSERKTVFAGVQDLITMNHELYGRAPEENLWGQARRIWPVQPDVFGPDASFGPVEATALREALRTSGMTDKQSRKWEDWLGAYIAHSPGLPMDSEVEGLISKLVDARDTLCGGTAQFPVAGKKQVFNLDAGRLLSRMLNAFLGQDYGVRLERTCGLFRVLTAFDAEFDRTVRAAGRLTFQDVPRLLGAGGGSPASSVWSGADVEYRLDGRFDHWLVDEFQDTSTLQWVALRNLVDEVLQTSDGSRSFFYVGDVKQSIYGWRQGDPRLFHLLQKHYASIELGPPLAESWRSSPVILDAVNAVFKPERLALFERMPPGVAARWKTDWTEHLAALPVRNLTGYVACYELPYQKSETKEARQVRILTALAALVAETPSDGSRGRAVLVRSNEMGRLVVESLRQHGIRAVREGTLTIADNPVVEGFLSLVRLAGHPGDQFSRQAIEMTPFGAWAATRGGSVAQLAHDTLREISEEGLPAVIRLWKERLPPVNTDLFTLRRWTELLDAAHEFEGGGGGGLDLFEKFIRSFEVGETPDPDAVRVLTVHKAKGLEFDAVFLPELEGTGLASSGAAGVAIQTADNLDRAVNWVLAFPPRKLAEADPVLRNHLLTLDAESAYESLCVFYVAMTRAKRHLVLLFAEPSETSTSLTPAVLARAALANEKVEVELNGVKTVRRYSAGDVQWAAQSPSPRAARAASMPRIVPNLEAPRVRLQRRLPSSAGHGKQLAAQIFTGGEAAAFGTALHAVFEQVEWMGPGVEAQALVTWRSRSAISGDMAKAVEMEFRHALAKPEFRAALTKPEGEVELWRERRFEMADEEGWISGCLDRVTLLRDVSGQTIAAEVMDYKSNEVRTDEQMQNTVDSYRPQLELYRRCLSRMLDIPMNRIGGTLLFTKPARAVRLFEIQKG